jgi:hypothetical protein
MYDNRGSGDRNPVGISAPENDGRCDDADDDKRE